MKIYCISIYNENYDFFKSNNLIPVGIGRKSFNDNWLNDNGKDNISSKNDNFGEYTFHYNLWKNGFLKENDNWTGFCTYRRFWVKKNSKSPKTFSDLKDILLTQVPKEWEDYDVVLPESLKLGKLKLMKIIKNDFKQLLKKPTLMFNKCTIKDHFNLFHGNYFIEEAINLLDENIKNDFEKYLNNHEFNPHNLFICKNNLLIKRYYQNVFEWLFKCEKKFENLRLDTFGKKRIYGFLAERFMPYWFRKNSKYLEWPILFRDLNDENF